jgi:serine/threonine protein kinase
MASTVCPDDTARAIPLLAAEERALLVARRRALPIGSLLGADRFRVLRRIGEGGMGVVYEAFDAQRAERVALKTLSQSDPRGIYQFKREFRSLSELHHPGLVRLHHLFAENDTWFFTMDLIDGERFDHWVRPGGALDAGRLRDALG